MFRVGEVPKVYLDRQTVDFRKNISALQNPAKPPQGRTPLTREVSAFLSRRVRLNRA